MPVRKLDFIKKLTFVLSMEKPLLSGKAVFFSNALFLCKKKKFSVKKKIYSPISGKWTRKIFTKPP